MYGEALHLLHHRRLADVAVELEHALVEKRALLVAEQLRLLRGEPRGPPVDSDSRQTHSSHSVTRVRRSDSTASGPVPPLCCSASAPAIPADSVQAAEFACGWQLLRGWLRLRLLRLVQIAKLVALQEYTQRRDIQTVLD